MFEGLKERLNLIWIPLALSIFGVYAIQRGFATFAKADGFGIPHMKEALAIYFTVMSVAVLVGGYFLDNFNSRKVMLTATLLGVLGILMVPYSPIGFGLLFGSAAAFIKLAPYSSPMKLFKKNEALRIAPQSAAKNIGGAAFILFLGTTLTSLGWSVATVVLACFFLLTGLMTYKMLPDDKMEGWKWDIFLKLIRDIKFWMMAVYFFLMCGFYYIAIYQFYPALTKVAGMPKGTAMTVLAVSYIMAGALRFLVAWLGELRMPNGQKFRLPLMWIGTAGMAASIYLTPVYPIVSLGLFTFMSAIHTPNYWAYCKEQWGPVYISTVVSLGFFFMYLGAGVMYGAW
jgi:MFS family permease